MTREEQQYMAGYDAGRAMALQTGSADAGHHWLASQGAATNAFIAGYEWALWDYEDANGLGHQNHRDQVTTHRATDTGEDIVPPRQTRSRLA